MSATLVHLRDPFRPHVNRAINRIRHGVRVDTVLRAHGCIAGKGRSMRRTRHFVVSIGTGKDAWLTEQDWDRKLKPSDVMTIVAVPAGGNALRAVAMIAVAVAAAWVTGGGAAVAGSTWFTAGSTSAMVAGATVGIAGPMLGKAVHA